jgi:hypothetical protein
MLLSAQVLVSVRRETYWHIAIRKTGTTGGANVINQEHSASEKSLWWLETLALPF